MYAKTIRSFHLVMIPLSCRNFASQVTRGKLEFGTTGIDGSWVGMMVDNFNVDTNKWYIGRLSCYNHFKEGDNPQSYSS